MNRVRTYILLSLLITASLLAGCAHLKTLGQDRDELLQQRAAAYAQAMNTDNIKVMFEMMDPDVRQGMHASDYFPAQRVRYADARVKSVDVGDEKEQAKTVIITKLTAMGLTFDGAEVEKYWVFKKGNWYIDPNGGKDSENIFSQ